MQNTDTQTKATLADLRARLSDDEISAVTGLSKSTLNALRGGRMAGTTRLLGKLRRALGIGPKRTREPAPLFPTKDLVQL